MRYERDLDLSQILSTSFSCFPLIPFGGAARGTVAARSGTARSGAERSGGSKIGDFGIMLNTERIRLRCSVYVRCPNDEKRFEVPPPRAATGVDKQTGERTELTCETGSHSRRGAIDYN